MTLTSTRFAALTIGAVAIVAVAFSAAIAAPAHAAGICPGTTFSTNLKTGSKGPDVMALQKFLNMSADTQVATSNGAGSPGNETSVFGGLTKAAVNKFQLKYAAQILTPNGLTTPTGNFFAASRAQANIVCAGGVATTPPGTTTPPATTTPPTTTGGTAVVAAAAQPANTIAPTGAARVPFTAFTVTANGAPVVVNSVTVQRQGPSVDTDFAGVVLIDASTGVQIGNSRVLDANHNATIGSAITIPAGMSKTFWVAGNIATGLTASGDIASFAVTAVNTASTVSASYPIIGASNTINASLAIGTAQISNSSFDPNSASTQPIGTTGYRFSGVKVNAGSVEDVTFKSITWYQSGSASGLQNVMTVVAGTSYPTTVDATGRYYTTVFPNGIVIPKGNSVDAYVTADLGANTTASTVAEFDIYRNTDIYLVGNQYGFGITPTITGTSGTPSTASAHGSLYNTVATGNPFFQGSTVSVTAGTFSTIQNATSVGAQNVATNVSNQPLGGFQTNLTGEGITVQSLKVHFNYTSGTVATGNVITSVSLVSQNGTTVAGPFDAKVDGGTQQTVTFTGAISFPVGTNTYTIQGKIPSTVPNNATVQASTTPSADWTSVTGNTTGNNITPTVGLFTMNTMTVKGAALNIGVSTNPTSQSVVAGGSNVLFANFQLDATQSGEDVRLSSLPLTFAGSGAATTTLSNCQVLNGSTALNTGPRVLNTTNLGATFTVSFDNALVVPKGTVVTVGLTCNIASGSTGTYSFGIGAGSNFSVSGVTSGSSVTVANAIVATGPTMTVSSGATLVASTDSSAPSYTVVAGGTTGVTANVIKFRASNEPVNLTKLGLTLTNAASSSASDLTNVNIYAGNNVMTTSGVAIAPNTLIGTATFLGTATFATSTLSTIIQLPKDKDATIIVKSDLATIGTNQPGHEGDLVAIDYLNSQGTGFNSGVTIYGNAGVTSGVAGLRTFATYPTVAAGPAAGTNPNGSNAVLKKFSISASTANSLGLYQLNISLATSSASVSNIKLTAYTDSGYSQPANVPGTTGGQFGAVQAGPFVNNPTLNFQQTTPFTIGAGGTYYFTLTGNVAPSGSANNWSINALLLGDSAYPTGLPTGFNMGQAATIAGTSNFVWSPNATSTATVNSVDWTNGYGVAGLPSTGL